MPIFVVVSKIVTTGMVRLHGCLIGMVKLDDCFGDERGICINSYQNWFIHSWFNTWNSWKLISFYYVFLHTHSGTYAHGRAGFGPFKTVTSCFFKVRDNQDICRGLSSLQVEDVEWVDQFLDWLMGMSKLQSSVLSLFFFYFIRYLLSNQKIITIKGSLAVLPVLFEFIVDWFMPRNKNKIYPKFLKFGQQTEVTLGSILWHS